MQNPLHCDSATGVCELPGETDSAAQPELSNQTKPLTVVYFTDPICSSCWGIEPQLRRLKLEYGHLLDFQYHMGGLLPDWSYNSGGISKPSDVARHWDEVSPHYQMPIDGDVWLEDPLDSSFPPSIAFKAAQLQDEAKAINFLRILREFVFLEKKNITKWEHLAAAAKAVGLDITQLNADYYGAAKTAFEEDLKMAREWGVRGFPTIFFVNAQQQAVRVYGARPYEVFQQAILQQIPEATPGVYSTNLADLFRHYKSLTVKEIAILKNVEFSEAVNELKEQSAVVALTEIATKNGSLWRHF